MKGMYRIVARAEEVGFDVALPEPDAAGILRIQDTTQDLPIAVVNVSGRGSVTGGHGWAAPGRRLVRFTGRYKDEQVCELLQRYDRTLREVI